MEIDEQIVYDLLGSDDQAVWSLLLASGYLKVKNYEACVSEFGEWKQNYELLLTNFEIRSMFRNMIRKWFAAVRSDHNGFIQALLQDNVEEMNVYMNRISLQTFSYFDTGSSPSWELPERFYHGFVLGMIVEPSDRYVLTSNRESGLGRYDVMLEPKNRSDDAIILEFKVQDAKEMKLSDTVQDALRQIEEKRYETALTTRGIPREQIRKYGFAFCGKNVLIGSSSASVK